MGKTEATGDAVLALADGRVFRGRAFGAVGETSGEVVFNTSMTGYQEISPTRRTRAARRDDVSGDR